MARVTPGSWLPALTGPVWGYRRRARLGAKFVRRKGRVVVGFRERAAPYVAQLAACEVLAAPAGELIAPLAELLTGLSIREQLPQIEVAVADNAIALVLRVLEPPTDEDRAALCAFAAAHGVQLYLQPGGPDSVQPLGAPGETLRYGLPRFGLRTRVRADRFHPGQRGRQPGAGRARGGAARAHTATPRCSICSAAWETSRSLWRAAPRARWASKARARSSRAPAPTRPATASATRSFTAPTSPPRPMRLLPWLRQPYTHVLLDPPRSGAREVLASVAGLAPQRVLYISCHPGSLARDLGVLVHEHGFTLEAAGVVDMFPHTAHVESLALLRATRAAGRAPSPT